MPQNEKLEREMHKITNFTKAYPSTKGNFGEDGIGVEYKGGSKGSEECLVHKVLGIHTHTHTHTHTKYVTQFALKENGK